MRRLPIVGFIAVVVAAIGSQFIPQPSSEAPVTRWVSPRTQLAAIFSYPQTALCDPSSGNCAVISSNGQLATTGGGGGGGSSTVYNGTGSQTLVPSSFLGDGGTYNATAQTFTSGQYSPFQTDVNGYLDVDVKTGGGGGSGATPIPFATNGSGQLVVAQAYPATNISTAAPSALPATAICGGTGTLGCAAVATNGSLQTSIFGVSAANGSLQVQFASPQPVYLSGTSAGLTSGNPLFVSQTNGSSLSFPYNAAQAQTATTTSFLGATGEYFLNPPTLTNGQVNPLAVDASGYLLTHQMVNGATAAPCVYTTCSQTVYQGTSPWVVNTAAPVTSVTANPGTGTFNVAIASGAGLASASPLYVYSINGGGGGSSSPLPYSGTAGPQTATATSFLGIGGIYNTATPTATNGQYVPSQVDTNGNIKVNIASGYGITTPLNVNVTNATAAPTTQAVAVTTALPAGANNIGLVTIANPTALPTPIAYTSAAPIPATIVNQPTSYVLGAGSATIGSIANTAFGISGSLPAGTNAIGSVTVSSTIYPYSLATGGQTAQPASGIGVLGQYNSTALTLTNGQVAPLQQDASGYLDVDIKAGSTGSASPSPLPYSLATSGQTATANSGVGIVGVYNSTSPTLTTGQAAPVQLDVNGNQEVNVQTPVTIANPVPTSAAGSSATSAVTVQGVSSGVPVGTNLSSSSITLPVTVASTSGSNTVVATNTTLAASTFSTPVNTGYGKFISLLFAATNGLTAGTVTSQCSGDGTTYFNVPTTIALAANATVSTVINVPAPCKYLRYSSTTALTAYSGQVLVAW